MVAASIGLVTPVLTRLPRRHAGWEEQAGIVEVAEIARAADRLGYDFLTCSEHVAIPTDVAPIRGSTYWDPLATFGYLAACTERIRFATYVLVLAYNHPASVWAASRRSSISSALPSPTGAPGATTPSGP
jgi:alkanesulfonate monooxygenase SsuD/methylene tetrahydromethanopterin reductase-like flavin-dependent oxidoreductase (luciferase family)